MSSIQARKTEFRGEVFRSKSEAIFAKMLSDRGYHAFEYEPEWLALNNGYIPDFIATFLSYTPFGPVETEFVIEYKPSQPTDTYLGEILRNFSEISSHSTSLNMMFSLWIGNAYDDERCTIYVPCANFSLFNEVPDIFCKAFKRDLIEAKKYRFDLKEKA